MNPHRLTWSTRQLPIAMLVAIPTLAGFVLTRDRKPFIWNRESILLFLFWGWVSVTTLFAIFPADAAEGWERFSKILLMACLTIPLFQDRQRLRWLLLVIAASVGYYGFKGGIFAVLTGGIYRIWGPMGSFLEDNNSLALALDMTIPILLYLGKEEERRWLRTLLFAMFFLSILAVPFTYSRSGFLGLIIVLSLLLLKSRFKLALIPIGAVAVFAFLAFAPKQWEQRIATIRNYEQDHSALARLMSWEVSYRLAMDNPLLGGGFWSIAQRDTFQRYMPDYSYGGGMHNAHSIYFNVLGEHGLIGLSLFLGLIFTVLHTLWELTRLAHRSPDRRWIANYAHMLQVGLVAYLVSGTFLSLSYFDLPYHFYVIGIILKRLAADADRSVNGQPDSKGLAQVVRG
jgi:probable O-glycosylation ligase (exosortase A-associated)